MKNKYLFIFLLLLPFVNSKADETYFILKIEIAEKYANYFSLENIRRMEGRKFTIGLLNGRDQDFPVILEKSIINSDMTKTLIFKIPLGISGMHQGAYAKVLLPLSDGHSIIESSALLWKGFFNKPAVIITDGKEFVSTEEITLLEEYPDNSYIAKTEFSKTMCIISDPEKYQIEAKRLSFYPSDICMQQKYNNNLVWVEGSVLLDETE